MILYRYRKVSKHNLEALEQNCINGSLFKTFNDGTELNFDVSKSVMDRYDVSESEKNHLLDILINNIRENYYLACFTTVSPYSKDNMWKRYAGNGNGYCLAYDYSDVFKAVKKRAPEPICLRWVNYDSKPFYLDEVVGCLCSPNGVKKELQEGNVDAAISKMPEQTKDQIVETLLHKVMKCKKEVEARLILQSIRPSGEQNSTFNSRMLMVKPRKIIISKDVNVLDQSRLINYANKNHLHWEVIPIPSSKTK